MTVIFNKINNGQDIKLAINGTQPNIAKAKLRIKIKGNKGKIKKLAKQI